MNFVATGFVDNGYFIRDSDTQGSFRFDGLGRKVYLIGVSFTTTSLYSKWVDWAAQEDNVKWLVAMRTVGNDPIPGGLTGLFLFLMNGWQVVADSSVTFDGIIYHDDDGVSPFVILPGGGVTNKVAALAYGVTASGSSPAEISTAILAAAQVTPIHADIQKVNAVEVKGTGTTSDPWNPV